MIKCLNGTTLETFCKSRDMEEFEIQDIQA